MKLPAQELCQRDPFLFTLWKEDERGFLSARKTTNQAFLMRRRFYLCYEALQKYLSPDKSAMLLADFACGTGNVGLLLAEDGYRVDFVDNQDKFFDYIRLKRTAGEVRFHVGDCSSFRSEQRYDAIFFGEALEHMAHPLETLANLRENLKTGGFLCLTTPNGDFVNGYEPSWSEVQDQAERNEKIANTVGNHVCEFTRKELSDLVKLAGFSILEHKLMLSDQVSRMSVLRRLLPERVLWSMDQVYSQRKNAAGKSWGRTQVLLAQRA